MKKSLFAILAVAACFASCSKVVESDSLGTPISFDPYVGKTAITKASVIGLTDLADKTVEGQTVPGTGVRVNAYIHNAVDGTTVAENFLANFMDNQVVKTDGTYVPTRYWPAADKQIDFVAWVPAANVKVDENDKSKLHIDVPSDNVKNQVDLLVSEPVLNRNGGSSTNEADKTVALKFKHLLSRIRFEIQGNSLPTDGVNVVTLSELSLNGDFASSGYVNMRAKGTDFKVVANNKETKKYSLTGEHFENIAANATEATSLDGNVLKNGLNRTKPDSYIMLIPDGNDPTYITLAYTVTTYKVKSWTKDESGNDVPVFEEENGEKVIDGIPVVNTAHFDLRTTGSGDNAKDFAFEAGKAYVYKFSITMDTVSFSVEVEDWVDDKNTEAEDNIEDNYPMPEDDKTE